MTLNSTTAGAVIYYTTNGTTPTTASAVYTNAIPVSAGTTTIEAMAIASGSSQSAVVAATYVVTQPVTATPTFNPAPGTYATAQNVMLSDSTAGAVIHYTTDGTTPTTSSAVYASAIPVGTGSTTIKAMAVASGLSPSAVVTAQYIIGAVTAAPTFSPAAGTYTTAQSVTLSDSTAGAVIYYTTNGTTPTTSSTVYSTPIGVAATETIEAIAVAPNAQPSSTAIAAYTIQSAGPTINFSNGFSSDGWTLAQGKWRRHE